MRPSLSSESEGRAGVRGKQRALNQVLVVAYHFPPIGGGGGGRSVKMVRYLPEFGYRSTVVTGPPARAGRWTPVDPSLSADVPPNTEALNVPGPAPPLTARGWRSRVERWFRVKSDFGRWWIHGAVSEARRADDVDVIYASMAPYESADVAARVAGELKRPWVADLRDPWALDEVTVYPTGIHRRLEMRRMRKLVSSAAAIVMSTSEAARRVQEAFPELRQKPILVIPNGFDPADFDAPRPKRSDTRFRIVHTGYLHSEVGQRLRKTAPLRRILGGTVRGFDLLTRSHVFLLEAIDRLIRDDPSLASTIQVHLAGVLSETDKKIASRSPVVHLLGYVPHRETVDLIRSADLLFLPMHDLPAGTRASIVPGKTYEYIASGRPILAAVPDGDARDILEEAGTAHLCRPSDVDSMVRIIAREIERWRSCEPTLQANPEVLRRFDYRELTRQLADVFDQVIEARVGPKAQ